MVVVLDVCIFEDLLYKQRQCTILVCVSINALELDVMHQAQYNEQNEMMLKPAIVRTVHFNIHTSVNLVIIK